MLDFFHISENRFRRIGTPAQWNIKTRPELIDNIMIYNGIRDCYDKSTEVLTSFGWKLFSDIINSDLICTFNQSNRQVEFQKPVAFIKRKAKNLITCQNRAVDFSVTPNSYILYEGKNNILKRRAVDFLGKKMMRGIPDSMFWNGYRYKHFILPGVIKWRGKFHKDKYERKLIPFEKWVRFMAIYLAEGCSWQVKDRCIYKIAISQNESPFKSEIRKLISDLGYHYSEYPSDPVNIFIYNKQLYSYLKQFGKSHSKFIPQEIKNSTQKSIYNFLYWYCLGDGTLRTTKNGFKIRSFYTVSKRMADDLQECIMKIGHSATIHNYFNKTTKRWIYVLNERHSTARYFKGSSLKINNYNDYVYDVEVPNHTLYIRRNGIPIWCSNCYLSISEFELQEDNTEVITPMFYFCDLDSDTENNQDIVNEDTAKLLNWADDENLTYSLRDSGSKGTHVLFELTRNKHLYSNHFRAFHSYLLNTLDLKTLDPSTSEIRRLCRVPGTINMKSGNYCETLLEHDGKQLDLFDYIKNDSYSPYNFDYTNGESRAKFPFSTKTIPCIELKIKESEPSQEVRWMWVKLRQYKGKSFREIFNEGKSFKWVDWNPELSEYQIKHVMSHDYSLGCRKSICIQSCPFRRKPHGKRND